MQLGFYQKPLRFLYASDVVLCDYNSNQDQSEQVMNQILNHNERKERKIRHTI